MKTAQCKQILSHLQGGHSITPVEALNKYKCFRLAARINDLRVRGYEIITRLVKRNGKKYASYSL
jgi:Helix-turn-helix domain